MSPAGADAPVRLLFSTARHDGVNPALSALHRTAGPDTLFCGPGGHVIASVQTAQSARRARLPDRTYERMVLTERDLTTPVLARAGLAGLRFTLTGSETQPHSPAPSLLVVWLRLGLSVRLRDTCLAYLEQRRTGDAPLLQQQMVKGQLADAAIDHLEAETALASLDPVTSDAATVLDADRKISSADHTLLTLLGAAGYLSDGPGLAPYVSGLITDLYHPRRSLDETNA